ncbi:hypothetical protein LIER_00896 [Lithospermum erythrorhizon]|uniref:Uncharacterized protein n=1 Tax=Lithospermum erythrorhizon TaxID=34254 RepID=A0AAV3NJ25_LITER
MVHHKAWPLAHLRGPGPFIRWSSISLKRSRFSRGVKIASPSSPPQPPKRPVAPFLAPRASPDKAAHDALMPLLDERMIRRILELAPGTQASHEISRL